MLQVYGHFLATLSLWQSSAIHEHHFALSLHCPLITSWTSSLGLPEDLPLNLLDFYLIHSTLLSSWCWLYIQMILVSSLVNSEMIKWNDYNDGQKLEILPMVESWSSSLIDLVIKTAKIKQSSEPQLLNMANLQKSRNSSLKDFVKATRQRNSPY